MPTYEQLPNGHWRAKVRIAGHAPQSRTSPKKSVVRDWALPLERTLRSSRRGVGLTFGDLLRRYAREISPDKVSGEHEQGRIAFYLRDPLASIALADLDTPKVAEWRDRRKREVSGSTVIRDMVILSHACRVARDEWHWLSVNPFTKAGRPKANRPRDRLVLPGELELLRHAAGTDYQYATARVIAAFEFAIETGMRGGEICGLLADQVRGNVAYLTHTKNGDKRDVPLSARAREIIAAMPRRVGAQGTRPHGGIVHLNAPVFGLSPAIKDALFRKIRARAGIVGLNYHDSRHTAITMLSRKLDVLALARVVGHRDIRQLQTYYNESAEELARRLD